MITHLDVALCTASCVVWSKDTSQAHVFRSLAVSIISSHVQHSFKGTLQVPYSLEEEEATDAMQKALQQYQIQQQESASHNTVDFAVMLKNNGFLRKHQGRVLLNAQQLLNVASKALQLDTAADKALNRVCELLTSGGLTVRASCDSLTSTTVAELKSDPSVSLTHIIQSGIAQIESSQAEDGAKPATTATADHWPSLPPAAPAQPCALKPTFTLASRGATSTSPREGVSSGSTSLPVSESGASTSAVYSSLGTGEELSSPLANPDNTITGFRARLKVGFGDDSLLWDPLLRSVHDITDREAEYTLPVKGGEELLEVLSLTLACCTVFPCNTGSQLHRLVLCMALVNCPADIAEINRGRHRCMKSFVEKLTYWCNRRMIEHGVHKADLIHATNVFEDDPFFFVSKLKGETRNDWVVLRLRQLAAVAVRLAEAPSGKYPNLPFPPTCANFDPSLQHNQSKPTYSVIQRLLQPPTRDLFSLAALDVLQRFSADASVDEVNELLAFAVSNANKNSSTAKWPPPLLAVPSQTALAAARKEQAAACKHLNVDKLIDAYKVSHPVAAGTRRVSDVDDEPAGSGVVGADYIDEAPKPEGHKKQAGKKQQGAAAAAPSVAAVAPQASAAATKALAKVQARKAAAETMTVNSFGLLEEQEEDEEEAEEEEAGSQVAAAAANRQLPPAVPAGLSAGDEAAIIEKHRWLLSMAGLDGSDSSDDDTPTAAPAVAARPQPTAMSPQQPAAPAPAAAHPPVQHQSQHHHQSTRPAAAATPIEDVFVFGMNGGHGARSSPQQQHAARHSDNTGVAPHTDRSSPSPNPVNIPLEKLFPGSSPRFNPNAQAPPPQQQQHRAPAPPGKVFNHLNNNNNSNSLFNNPAGMANTPPGSAYSTPPNGSLAGSYPGVSSMPPGPTIKPAPPSPGYPPANQASMYTSSNLNYLGAQDRPALAPLNQHNQSQLYPAYPGMMPGASNPFSQLPHDPHNPYAPKPHAQAAPPPPPGAGVFNGGRQGLYNGNDGGHVGQQYGGGGYGGQQAMNGSGGGGGVGGQGGRPFMASMQQSTVAGQGLSQQQYGPPGGLGQGGPGGGGMWMGGPGYQPLHNNNNNNNLPLQQQQGYGGQHAGDMHRLQQEQAGFGGRQGHVPENGMRQGGYGGAQQQQQQSGMYGAYPGQPQVNGAAGGGGSLMPKVVQPAHFTAPGPSSVVPNQVMQPRHVFPTHVAPGNGPAAGQPPKGNEVDELLDLLLE